MRIQHNISALNVNNHLGLVNRNLTKATEKLSSGFRINRSADDAAGLAISEKMRAQIRGLDQAQRNVQDGISLVQVAEGGLNEIHSILQRVKELSTKAANGTYVAEERKDIQSELDSLVSEIDRIADSTNFNNIKLLNGTSSSAGVSTADKQKFIDWLNGSWLSDAAKKVESTTGWKIDPSAKLNVKFKNIGGSAVAQMSGFYADGPTKDLTLTVNTGFMSPGLTYVGTDGPTLGGIPADRLITHEMVHGFMFNNVDSASTPKHWFIEGIAEAVHGASDVRYSLYESGMSSDFSAVKQNINNFDFSSSSGNNQDYTVGYLATSYLYTAVENKSSGSFKTMLGEMKTGTKSFEQLVSEYTGSADFNTFVTQMKNDANTAANFNEDFLKARCGIDLTDGKADPLVGGDASSSAVIPNSGSATSPTGPTTTIKLGSTDVTVNWEDTSSSTGGAIVLQIGSSASETLSINIDSATSSSLGVENISVLNQSDAGNTMELCDKAIDTVSGIRADLGAYQNRLEHTGFNLSAAHENTVSAESRIHDTDMAKEMMKMMKEKILMQAGQSIAAQAMQSPNSVLQLLKL